jgi:hypothetical protein
MYSGGPVHLLVLDAALAVACHSSNVQARRSPIEWRTGMATYGLVPNAQVPFTGYTNTLGTGQANAYSATGSVYFNGVTQGDDRIAKMLRNGGMTAGVRQLMYTLLGAAAGASAVRSKAQVQGIAGGPSGACTIEVVPLVNRNTTAADLTAFQGLMNRNVMPATYPPDLSGNGGGGRVGL